MTNSELLQLQTLLTKLKADKPELTVLVAEISEETVHELTHESKDFYCDLSVQVEICLDDEENDNLR